MGNWEIVRVLPSVSIQSPIEYGHFALVSSSDERVELLKSDKPNTKRFLDSFRDEFDTIVRPSLILANASAPKYIKNSNSPETFRDIVAVAAICRARSLQVNKRNRIPLVYSDYFQFYPWNLARDDQYITAFDAVGHSIHLVNEFRGNSSPNTSPINLEIHQVDKTLMNALLRRWKLYLRPSDRSQLLRRLFRSLNMANQAALMPVGQSEEAFRYSEGRSITLWLSAFEILLHPGARSIKLSDVYDRLGRANVFAKELRARRYLAHQPWKGPKKRYTLACKLYGLLYNARNAFVHGNKLRKEHWLVRGKNVRISLLAAALYRMALAEVLGLVIPPPPDAPFDSDEFTEWFRLHAEFQHYQRASEQALLATR